MSRDQISSSSDERVGRRDLVGLDVDQIESTRLAEILTATELRMNPDLDPVEDPALAALAKTADTLRLSLEAASATASFGSFHQRSRAHVLAATPRPAREPAVAERRGLFERWNGLFTSVASAGAAAVATFVVTVLALGGGSSEAPVLTVAETDPPPEAAATDAVAVLAPTRVNLTSLSVNQQITRYVELLERLDALTNGGQPADVELLRDLAETSSTVARTIEERPEAVTGVDAWIAYQAAFKGQTVLNNASVASDDTQQVLNTAQVAAGGAFVTAARFLENPTQAPTYDQVATLVEVDSDVTIDASDDPDPGHSP